MRKCPHAGTLAPAPVQWARYVLSSVPRPCSTHVVSRVTAELVALKSTTNSSDAPPAPRERISLMTRCPMAHTPPPDVDEDEDEDDDEDVEEEEEEDDEDDDEDTAVPDSAPPCPPLPLPPVPPPEPPAPTAPPAPPALEAPPRPGRPPPALAETEAAPPVLPAAGCPPVPPGAGASALRLHARAGNAPAAATWTRRRTTSRGEERLIMISHRHDPQASCVDARRRSGRPPRAHPPRVPGSVTSSPRRRRRRGPGSSRGAASPRRGGGCASSCPGGRSSGRPR